MKVFVCFDRYEPINVTPLFQTTAKCCGDTSYMSQTSIMFCLKLINLMPQMHCSLRGATCHGQIKFSTVQVNLTLALEICLDQKVVDIHKQISAKCINRFRPNFLLCRTVLRKLWPNDSLVVPPPLGLTPSSGNPGSATANTLRRKLIKNTSSGSRDVVGSYP